MPALFAATPLTEGVKLLLSKLAESRGEISLIYADVSRAYFCAPAVRPVYVVIPDDEPRSLEDGTDVTGHIFGAEKLHFAKLLCADGQERFVLRVLPPNCYQIPLPGDINTLPTG